VSVKTFSTHAGDSPARTRAVLCCLCGSPVMKVLWNCGDFGFVRCGRCGLIQQNPQPVPEDVLGRYAAEYCAYEERNEKPFLDLMMLALHDIGFEAVSQRLFATATSLGRAPRFLDVGCATGALIGVLHTRGWESSGVEPDAESARVGVARNGAPIFVGTLEDARFQEGSFDVVYSSHTIEHLNDPSPWIKEVFRVLAPGGFFICITPNAASLQRLLFGSSWRSVIYDHLYLFSKKTLIGLASGAGFRVRRVRSWGGLAAGIAPLPLKTVIDRLAKVGNVGDVMVCLFEKPA
jgi:SAM-dependent methyltransferase